MAQVIDLNKCRTVQGESYFVDTNVWFWISYVASKEIGLPNHPRDYQINDYPAFIERALNDGAMLCHSALTLAELASVIENTELEIYRLQPGKELTTKKEFRRDSERRNEVLNEIKVAWDTINTMSKCIDAKFDLDFANSANDVLREGCVDPHDAFYIRLMRKVGIDYIITDDHDFADINHIIMLTSNAKALNQ